MKTRTQYLCGFCNRAYLVEKNCINHEKQCYHNPANHACATCKYFVRENNENHYLAGGEDHIQDNWELGCEIDKMPCLPNSNEPSPTVDCGYWEAK